jgi:hypothetical protein
LGNCRCHRPRVLTLRDTAFLTTPLFSIHSSSARKGTRGVATAAAWVAGAFAKVTGQSVWPVALRAETKPEFITCVRAFATKSPTVFWPLRTAKFRYRRTLRFEQVTSRLTNMDETYPGFPSTNNGQVGGTDAILRFRELLPTSRVLILHPQVGVAP